MELQQTSSYQQDKELRQVKIPAGSTTSSYIDLGGTRLMGVEIPAGFIGIKLTIEGSINGTFYQLYGSETGLAKEIKITAAPALIMIENSVNCPFEKIRLVSSATETSERILNLICHP